MDRHTGFVSTCFVWRQSYFKVWDYFGWLMNSDDTVRGGTGAHSLVALDSVTKLPQVELPKKARMASADPKPVIAARNKEGMPIRGRRHSLTVLGLNKDLAKKGDPLWLSCLHKANTWRKLRNKEFYLAHGYVSTGVGSLLASAGLAMAASRFIYEKMSETGDISLLKTASQLADSAQRHELAAWELCKREAIENKKKEAGSNPAPWIKTLDGGEKRRGPKHKHTQLPTEEMPHMVTVDAVGLDDAGNSGET